jgi:hypothetical protein
MEISQIEPMLPYIDCFQVGARNMQNFNLLRELGKVRKPVLLKRGIAATIEEVLLSSEYILSGGNYDLILCERGIRTYETYTRNTMDISAIPVLKKLSHLPIIGDPSHGTGRRDMVPAMAKAAVAAGADGIIVEVHPNPDKALSTARRRSSPISSPSWYPYRFAGLRHPRLDGAAFRRSRPSAGHGRRQHQGLITAAGNRLFNQPGRAGFLPGHPMAGKEVSGAAKPTPISFADAVWIFTTDPWISQQKEGDISPEAAASLGMEWMQWIAPSAAASWNSKPRATMSWSPGSAICRSFFRQLSRAARNRSRRRSRTHCRRRPRPARDDPPRLQPLLHVARRGLYQYRSDRRQHSRARTAPRSPARKPPHPRAAR